MITWNTISHYNLATYEWKWIFHSIPSFKRIQCYEGNALNRFWQWLTDPWFWDSSCWPSFAKFFRESKVKLLNDCTPWYRLRRRFIEGFVNPNCCKLLSDGFGWTHVRNRQENCAYYTLKFSGFHYKLTRTILVNSKGEACNAFLESICGLLDDEESDTPKEIYSEKTELIHSGWIFTRRQAVDQLNKIAKLTPDLEWIKLNENGEYPDQSEDLNDIEMIDESSENGNCKSNQCSNESIGDSIIERQVAEESPDSGIQS